jgi:hypothetical protein
MRPDQTSILEVHQVIIIDIVFAPTCRIRVGLIGPHNAIGDVHAPRVGRVSPDPIRATQIRKRKYPINNILKRPDTSPQTIMISPTQ